MKRNDERRRSGAEQRLDNQRHLSLVERDAVKQRKANQIHSEQEQTDQPENNDRIRACRNCECSNNKGICDNYFLHAVLKDKCLIKEAT